MQNMLAARTVVAVPRGTMLRMPARMVGSVRMPVRALSMTHAVARSDKFRAERDTFGDLQVPADKYWGCLLYTSPSPRDLSTSRMPSSA